MVDNRCSGDTDESDTAGTSTFYPYRDSNVYGDSSVITDACNAPSVHVDNSVYCDDSSGSAYPGTAGIP